MVRPGEERGARCDAYALVGERRGDTARACQTRRIHYTKSRARWKSEGLELASIAVSSVMIPPW